MTGGQMSTNEAPENSAASRWRILLVFATALLLAAACRKMQFNPDSIHYVDVARTIAEDRVIGTWHLTADSQRAPETLLYWPPAYPVALAIFFALGLSASMAAWAVSVAGYAASVWLLTAWQRRPGLALAGTLAFLHLIFLAGAPFRAWSESVFIPLTLASLVCMASATAATSTRRSAWLGFLAGVLGGGAVLTRYVGIALVPALAGAALLSPPDEDEREKNVRRNSLIAAMAGMALTMLPWLIRNLYLHGVLFGPDRPANMRPLSVILYFTGKSVYYDLGPLLLAFIFMLVGYHLVRRNGAEQALPSGWTRTGALIWGGVICAAGQFAIVLLTYLRYHVDEPPTTRYFMSVYACLLLAGLAWGARARLPEDALTRRWPLLLIVALPIVIGPLFAEAVSTDVTPRYTALDRWVEEHTGPNDLLIADRGWPLRFYTGRPVLEAGQVAAPSVTDGEKVAAMLERLGAHFDQVYLLPRNDEEAAEALAGYDAAGLRVEEVARVITQPQYYRHHEEYEQTVYRVTGWR